jgi:hypothetical protein
VSRSTGHRCGAGEQEVVEALIRFGRPHGATVRHLGDGRGGTRSNRPGEMVTAAGAPALAGGASIRTTKVVLAAAHLDHNPVHCGRRHRNVKALCANAAICCTTGPSIDGGSG